MSASAQIERASLLDGVTLDLASFSSPAATRARPLGERLTAARPGTTILDTRSPR